MCSTAPARSARTEFFCGSAVEPDAWALAGGTDRRDQPLDRHMVVLRLNQIVVAAKEHHLVGVPGVIGGATIAVCVSVFHGAINVLAAFGRDCARRDGLDRSMHHSDQITYAMKRTTAAWNRAHFLDTGQEKGQAFLEKTAQAGFGRRLRVRVSQFLTVMPRFAETGQRRDLCE